MANAKGKSNSDSSNVSLGLEDTDGGDDEAPANDEQFKEGGVEASAGEDIFGDADVVEADSFHKSSSTQTRKKTRRKREWRKRKKSQTVLDKC